MKKSEMKRREFLKGAAAAAAVATVVPRCAVARSGENPPSEKLNIAGIGIGGMGGGDIDAVAGGNNIVALCDVDMNYARGTFGRHPKAKQFQDFRKMLDAMDKQIDAVVVGTPDHNHAVTSIAAMRHGKHVYCEKPLAHSVYECRQMAKVAKEQNVVTQMGNQGHSFESCRLLVEWVRDGAIGKVHTIHCGCAAVNSAVGALGQLKQKHKVPDTLNWDLWLGPAPQRDYCPAFLPYQWRGWVPFGNGTVGDWVCHVVDPVFWALDLGAPKTIVSDVKDYDPKTQAEAFPPGEKIIVEFPAKGDRGPITMYWYSGTVHIPRPADLEQGRNPVDTGAVVLGDKGTIMYGSHGAGGVRIIPESKMQAYKRPAQKLPQAPEHHQDWLQAIRKGKKAGSDFSYGGPLTEIAMLGVIASKMPGTKLEWDGEAMRFTNSPAANALVNPPYRTGWTL
ncbi:MAG: Gfo/Idh/MocA family oxidoreductase [Thermoguttaceae bacterium]|jgi:predicted dehydrogenase